MLSYHTPSNYLKLLNFQVLPEGWSLASYLSVIVQIANLGPITYSLVRWMTSGRLKQTHAIYSLFAIGTLSSVLLASFWNETSEVVGSNRSTALFVLVFCLSLVDCTSSVLFLPFMALFRFISIFCLNINCIFLHNEPIDCA